MFNLKAARLMDLSEKIVMLQFRWKRLSALYIHVLLSLLLFCPQDCSKVAEAAGFRVNHLPGFNGTLPFHLETGYIGVGENEEVQLFYYFTKSESDNPEKDPLMLWLTGGPGCSGIYGFMNDIGPITFEPELCPGRTPKLVLRPNSWTKVANIVFLDLPVGTGFSYAKTPEASHSTDLQACGHAYEFLRKWIVEHPDFMFSPVFVGGDSFAGMSVPIVTQLISDGNSFGILPRIDLKGYLLGNPLASGSEVNYGIQVAHGFGLISDELYESLKDTCGGRYYPSDPANFLCSKYVQDFNQLVSHISTEHVLEFYCFNPRTNKLPVSKRSLYGILKEKPQDLNDLNQCTRYSCRMKSYELSNMWANDEHVRTALHVRKGTKGEWERCNRTLSYTITVGSSVPYIANLSIKGYRSLIYSGDHDMVASFIATQAWIRSLKYPIVDEWRQWSVGGQVAGYTRTYANQMTFATVKGAGHIAPEYKGPECKAMFERWISSKPL